MRIKNYTWFSAVLLLVVTVCTLPTAVFAHAGLSQSFPAQEAQLDEAPNEIRVKFTEPIDTKLSTLMLKDEYGNILETGMRSEGDLWLIMQTPELPEGIYYVSWQVLSKDTHITDGSYRFSVGVPLPKLIPEETISLDQPAPVQKEHIVQGAVLQTLFRQAEILMAMILGGWLFFRYIIWGKAPTLLNRSKRFSRFFPHRLFLVSLIVYLVTGIGEIWIRAAELSSVNPGNGDFLRAFMQVASGTTLGIVSWLRPLIILGMIIFVPANRPPNLLLIGIAIGGLLITFPLTGHAAGNGMIISHTVHLLMATAWLGGLLGFTVYSFFLKKEVETLRLIHERLTLFSALAMTAVLLAVLTGAVMAAAYLWGKAEPVNHMYKIVLFWKIVLFAGALLIAAWHRFVWLPRLKKTEWQFNNDKMVRRLFMGLRAELLLAVAVTLLAGIMSTVSPLMADFSSLERQTTPVDQRVPGESPPASHSH